VEALNTLSSSAKSSIMILVCFRQGFAFPAFTRNKAPKTPSRGLPPDWLDRRKEEFAQGVDIGAVPNKEGEIVDFETGRPMYDHTREQQPEVPAIGGGEVALDRLDKAIERAQQDSRRSADMDYERASNID